MIDTQLLDFIQEHEALLTFATSEPPERSWRCAILARRFPTPDIRERSEKIGFGRTAREAIVNCMAAPVSG